RARGAPGRVAGGAGAGRRAAGPGARPDRGPARTVGGARTLKRVRFRPVFADIGDFFDAVDKFFSSLASIRWGSLLLGLLCFAGFLTLRSRAAYNVLRAAYPTERFPWRKVWGAYMAAYGVNNVFPVR